MHNHTGVLCVMPLVLWLCKDLTMGGFFVRRQPDYAFCIISYELFLRLLRELVCQREHDIARNVVIPSLRSSLCIYGVAF